MERMSVTLSIWSASIGMVSLTCMPSTLVLMALNSPRMLAGASGFGSQMSMWLGPPCRKSMMTDFAPPNAFEGLSSLAAACAFQEKNSGRFRPSRVAPPTRINSRRDHPSQLRTGRPGIVSKVHRSFLTQQDYITGADGREPVHGGFLDQFRPLFRPVRQPSATAAPGVAKPRPPRRGDGLWPPIRPGSIPAKADEPDRRLPAIGAADAGLD